MNFRLLTTQIFLVIGVLGYAQKNAEVSYNVQPVTSKIIFDGHQSIYALPRNLLRIEVNVKKTIQIVGPYYEYAERFLNISDGIIPIDNSFYELMDIKMNRLSIPDSNQIFVIQSSGNSDFPMLQLNQDGVILGCNSVNELAGYNPFINQWNLEPEVEDFVFTDLGVVSFVEEKAEKTSKMVQTDSVPVKVFVTQNKMVNTSTEYNAKEAADFIRKLRKRRMKLAMGYADETFPVEAQSLSQMLQKLDEYEQKYLELFIGKTIETTQSYIIDFDPEDAALAEQKIIGWFSGQKGYSVSKPDMRKGDFEPLEVKTRIHASLPDFQVQLLEQSKKPTAINHGLYYRIPRWVEVSVMFGNMTLYNNTWLIAQKGKTAPLSANLLNNGRYAIEFYPETGALKRVYLNNNK